jgi:hypothetical protein
MSTARLIRIVALLALMLGCGSVTPAALQISDGPAVQDSGIDAGPLTTDAHAQGTDAGPSEFIDASTCIGGDGDVIGFAYNPGCDGGNTLPTSCHAGCELNGAHFVGCSNDSRVDGGRVICHASCEECQ